MPAFFDHEKLRVYQEALRFAAWVPEHMATGNVRSQLERAASSIVLNIAEGNGRSLVRDRCRFLEIARGSTFECAACLDIAVALSSLSQRHADEAKACLSAIVAMLTGLMNALQDRCAEDGLEYEMAGTAESESEKERESESEKGKDLLLPVRRKPGCEDLPLPRYMSPGASGMDLCAAVDGQMTIEPGKAALVPTGLHIAVPAGYEAQIRPRSGLAIKHRVTVLNTPGTVDSDYRNEVCVVMANLGDEPFVVTRGMRIAQMVICRSYRAELVEMQDLDQTERNMGGFGSTGTH